MRAFRFNLAALLRVYEQQEDEKKRALGSVSRELMDQQDVLERLREEYRDFQETEQRVRQDLHDIAHVRTYISYMFKLKGDMYTQRQTIAHTRRRYETARAALIEASRKRKALERLKQKKFAEYKKQRKREDARFTDEVGMQGYLRTLS